MDSAKYNTIFILLSCLIAQFLPFELILASYAFLGPAHYLTEISWLHDKDYFLGNHWIAIILGLGTLGVILFPKYWDIYIYGSILTCLAMTFGRNNWFQVVLIFFGAILFFKFYEPVEILSIVLMVLLPTIIHVFLFTYFFILAGYFKRSNTFDLINLILIPIAILSFFFIKAEPKIIFPNWVFQNIGSFRGIGDSILFVLGHKPTVSNSLAISKFVSFAYTFHYLNWFSKTNMLRWHQTSVKRNKIMIILYIFFVGIYLYNYKTGLKILFFLSVYHVVLEFPLNFITLKGLLFRRKE